MEQFAYTIRFRYLRDQDPTLTNIGDIFKSFQAIVNLFGEDFNLSKEGCSMQVFTVESFSESNDDNVGVKEISFLGINYVEPEIFMEILEKVEKTWNYYNSNDFQSLFQLLNIDRSKIRKCFPSLPLKEIIKFNELSQEIQDRLRKEIPNIEDRVSRLTNVARARKWKILIH